MARTQVGSGRLQPYTFTAAATNGTSQASSHATKASTAIPNEPMQSIPYLEQDREVLEAAQILMSIYRSGTHASALRKDSRLASEKSPGHGHDSHVFNVELAPPRHDEDDDLEMLDSPTKQFQERTTKRRTTRGRAVVTKKPPTRMRSARYPANSRHQDREYFENPVLTVIHNSPAQKSRRAQGVGQVKDSTHGDTTEVDSSTPSNDDDFGDGDYIDQSPTPYRKPPILRHGSSSSTLVPKLSRTTTPTGYVTPLGPTTSPLSRSSDSCPSATILAQDSPTKSLSVAPRTPSRASVLDHVKPSSVTSLQKFLSEARRTRGHRRTESLESSGFFEKVKRAHVALHEGSGEDEDEDMGVGVEEELDEREIVKDEDSEGDVGIRLDDLAPGVKDEDESSGREEGETSDDDDDNGATVSPPRWHRGFRGRGFDRSTVLNY